MPQWAAAVLGRQDDASDAGVDAPSDALTDVVLDAMPEAAVDAGSEACPPGWPPDGDGGCLPPSVRRPFLVGSAMRKAGAERREDWLAALSPVSLDRATAQRLAASYLQDGLEEHASIAAFARFALMLLSVGAPPELVVAAQRASLDEVAHARACFGLARRYGAEECGPGPLSLDGALEVLALPELAALSAEEGCVGETLGALLAIEQLAVARDSEVVRLLDKLARDEVRHAELAWRFARWAVLADPDRVVPAVSRALDRALDAAPNLELSSYDGIDLGAWHAHGRLTCHEAREAVARGISEVVRPSIERLLAPDATRQRRVGQDLIARA